MKKEALSIAKTLIIVIGGVLLANAIDRKFLSAKVALPAQAQE
jgi:hypothetical protein